MAEIADLRAALARAPLPASRLPIVVELPDDDTRTARVVWSDVKDGKQHICIVVSDSGAAPEQAGDAS
jgi:hypothetical protein